MFKLEIDISKIMDMSQLNEKARDLAEKYSQELADATYAKIADLANERLTTRLDAFMTNLKVKKEYGAATQEITLAEKALWIEDGMEGGSMVERMLKSPKAKVGKGGKKYMTIPFTHKYGTQVQSALFAAIKRGFDKKKLEGKLDETKARLDLNINDSPISTNSLKIGKGKVGGVASGVTGIPLLQGVRAYKQPNGGYLTKTFRTISELSNKDAWIHPGLQPTNILKDAADWAEEQVDSYVEKVIKSL